MNEACLSKLGWELHSECEDLWCKVVWGEYGRDYDRKNMSLKNTNSRFRKTWPKYGLKLMKIAALLVGISM